MARMDGSGGIVAAAGIGSPSKGAIFGEAPAYYHATTKLIVDMRLAELEIEAYRSVANKLTLKVQDELICLIGANESGKSNILNSISFLAEGEFSDFDRNSESQNVLHPRITFTLRLNSSDRRCFIGCDRRRFTGSR